MPPPPGTEPLPQRILEAMQTALALADGGADYYYDLNVIKVGEDIFQASVFPAVTIGIGEIGRVLESREGRALWTGNFRWHLSIIGALDGFVDAPKRLSRLFHDIHRALMTDERLGGLALGMTVTGCDMLPPIGEDTTRCWLEVGVEVHFRTSNTSLLTGA